MTDVDDWDDHESPQEYEEAQRQAEEPPDWYLEEEAERQHQRHLDEDHGGLVCDCPPYKPPRCRLLFRPPRWTYHHRWQCGTPGACLVALCASPLAAWRLHRQMHQTDEPPF
jgi:hypothetical protein